VVASRTTNPLLLALLVAVLALVVAERRTAGPWSRAFVVMLRVGLLLIALKVVVAVLLTGVGTGPVWLRLPAVPMPDWLVGLRLGGPVHADVVLAALYDGLRLAAILACVGAANALVVPSRLLRALPAALYEVGVAVVISMTVLPMLVADLGRVREARRLRGRDTGRITAAAQMALPVLNGALDRAVSLAAAMDSRGYGRAGAVPRRVRLVTSTAVVVGLAGVALGVYGVLDGGAPGVAGVSLLGWPAVVAGCTLAVAAALLARRRVGRSVYRPDPWRLPEVLVVATGLVAVVAVVTTQAAGVAGLEAPLGPPWWPALPALPTLGLLAALLAIPASPPLPWQHRPDRLPASAPRRPALTATAGEAT
jgi:energy-coupling factor transport system permease protein